eukprot:2684895-Lingulodinium_polyedra.AAC.1
MRQRVQTVVAGLPARSSQGRRACGQVSKSPRGWSTRWPRLAGGRHPGAPRAVSAVAGATRSEIGLEGARAQSAGEQAASV